MQANTDKFQAICIGKKTYEAIKHSDINDTVIQCESNVTLLCVNIDFMLSFNDHVREICKKKNNKKKNTHTHQNNLLFKRDNGNI